MLEVDKANESFWKSGLAMIGVTQFSGLVRLAWRALLGLASLPLIASPAGAQVMREVVELPTNCTNVLPPEFRGTVQPWEVYVRLEQCGPMKNLRNLSTDVTPNFSPRATRVWPEGRTDDEAQEFFRITEQWRAE